MAKAVPIARQISNILDAHFAEIEALAAHAYSPLGFVMDQFPWGEEGGPLESFERPEDWQIKVLTDIGEGISPHDALREAVASGHGVGKSALVAWIILWALATYVDARAIITANTEAQLATKTWPELGKWHSMMRCKHLFTYTATSLFSALSGHEKNWRADAQPWSEKSPESWAGLHNKGKRAVVIMDEASAINDKVWDTAEGAFTDSDTERLWLAFGNPTRNAGRFRECFGKFRAMWRTMRVDARTVRLTDKAQIKKWEDAYGGDDSDFFRIRVKGEFPRASSSQFISSEVVRQAQKRTVEVDRYDPLICGVDVARFGTDDSVFRFRKGFDAQSFPVLRFNRYDTMQIAAKIFEVNREFKVAMFFVDETGVGAGVVDRCRQMGMKNVMGINFSWKADGIDYDGTQPRYANKRAEIWGNAREWLKNGAIDESDQLRDDLINVQYGFNARNEIILESKDDMRARGVSSPDDGDAFCLTFSYPVELQTEAGEEGFDPNMCDGVEFDPFANEKREYV